MALRVEHELHKRRFGRNMAVGLILVGFVAIIFGLTVVKVRNTGFVEGYDHTVRTSVVPPAESN